MTSLARRLRPLLIACALIPLAAVAVLGHAELDETDPVDGGTIERTPYTFVARFTEEVDPARSRIVVRNAAGEQVAEGGVLDDDAFTMAVELPPLPPGAYVARWTAVGTDGHIERGNVDFTVQGAPATPTPIVTPSPTGPSGASPTPTASPTGSPAPGALTPLPTSSPPPEPGTGEPAAAELLVGLLAAGLLVAGLVYFLLRQRP